LQRKGTLDEFTATDKCHRSKVPTQLQAWLIRSLSSKLMVTIADPNFLLGSTIAGAVPLAKSFEQDCCIPCQNGVGKMANPAVEGGGEVGAVLNAGAVGATKAGMDDGSGAVVISGRL
jgi:hypothetical protein